MPKDTTQNDGGFFGRWRRDGAGLPCFDYEVGGPSGDLVLPQDDPRIPWHQVGNDRITATAHAGGWTTLYFTDRGYLRLSGTDPDKPSELGGYWRVLDGAAKELLSPHELKATVRPRFGQGYAEWQVHRPGAQLWRRVWAPFGDAPFLLIDVSVRGEGAAVYEEGWGVSLYSVILGGLMARNTPPPATHSAAQKALWRYGIMNVTGASRAATEALRSLYRSRLRLDVRFDSAVRALVVVPRYEGPLKPDTPQKAAWFDAYPKPFFLASLNGEFVCKPRESSRDLAVQMRVHPQGETSLSFAVGQIEGDDLSGTIQLAKKTRFGESARAWKEQLSFEMPAAPWAERELSWHAYYLRSAKIRDDYFEGHIAPQGSAYGYIHGLHGAARDYLLTAAAQTYYDPAGAKDHLRFVMRTTLPDGTIYYGHTGVGKCTWAGMHTRPSDIPIFFLWALTEYVWATGDRAFLDEWLPFYPKGDAGGATVRERAALAYRYLKEKIGLGPHVMLHVGSGDWSDPISLMVESRRRFLKNGESGFNTAFACYVLPRVALLLKESHPQVAREIDFLVDELRTAMSAAWTGKWFLRGWDGGGRPIGEDHLFLDCQVWCLIARLGEPEMRKVLVREIRERLDDPSPIGATILDKPHKVRLGVLGSGWDCNGGVWAAVNGLLCWAYSLEEPELAWRNFYKQSLAAHARAYPNIWYGIWSGPDAYNAHWADRAGETFVHPATPMREYPLMNTNQHALPLLALFKLAGVEPGPGGIAVSPRIPVKAPWRIQTPLLTIECDGAEVSAKCHEVDGVGGVPVVVKKTERVE